MINDMVKQAFIDNAPSDVRGETAMWFDVRNETLNRCYSIDGYEEMDKDMKKAIYDSVRSQVVAESNIFHVYAVEIYGQDYDYEHDDWVEDTHELVSIDWYDTYDEAAVAVKGITPLSAMKMERQVDCNGLDIVIYERWGNENVNEDWREVGYAEWIGACCNGIWV